MEIFSDSQLVYIVLVNNCSGINSQRIKVKDVIKF